MEFTVPCFSTAVVGYTSYCFFRSGPAGIGIPTLSSSTFTGLGLYIDGVGHYSTVYIYDVVGSDYTVLLVCNHMRWEYAAVAAPLISVSFPYPWD